MTTVAATIPAPGATYGPPDLSRSHPFTCVTCAIAFRSSKMQRDHMRSDWHRYNLKRRVASLPPLSSEIFAAKVLTAQASSSAAAAKASFEKACAACQKTYYSENAFQNHLGSQRHRTRVAHMDTATDTEPPTPSIISSTISLGDPIEPAAPEDVEDPEVEAAFSEVVRGMKGANVKGSDDDDDDDGSDRPSRPHASSGGDRPEHPLSATPSSSAATRTSTAMPLSRCLFCNYDSPSFKLSVLHMYKHHGMFVPEQDYLTDLEGLVSYLQAKVTENFECLFCHKLKNSVSGVQTHMRDKGHTMIAFDSEEELLEIGQFYDFRSTYSDSDEDGSDSDSDSDSVSSASTAGPASKKKPVKSAKLGTRRAAADNDDDDEGADADKEDGWETDSSDEGDGDGKSGRARRPRRPIAYLDGNELHLPSGRTAGHRSFARYFRQNLRDYPGAAERAERAQRLLSDRADGDGEGEGGARGHNRQMISRADGGLGMLGVSDATKRTLAAVAHKQERKAQRTEAQYRWGIQSRANNQKHFRDDNFGIRL